MRVYLTSGAAVVSSRWKGQGSHDGREFHDDQRSSIVLTRSGRDWLVLSEHSTEIAPLSLEVFARSTLECPHRIALEERRAGKDNSFSGRGARCYSHLEEHRTKEIMKLPNNNRDYFFELETALQRRQVRNSVESVSELLAEEFTEFGSSGRIFNKAAIIEILKKNESEQVLVDNFDAQELAPGVVLVTYIAKGESQAATCTLRSSIWKLIAGRWQMVFHQGTKIPSSPSVRSTA